MNFKNYANYYDDIYKKKTYIKEVKFLASILKFQKDKSYFDCGCGTFEHFIKLLNKVKKLNLMEWLINLWDKLKLIRIWIKNRKILI